MLAGRRAMEVPYIVYVRPRVLWHTPTSVSYCAPPSEVPLGGPSALVARPTLYRERRDCDISKREGERDWGGETDR